MAARHDAAISCMDPDVSFKELAYALILAVEECEEEEREAHIDAAAVLIVARLAFMTSTEMLHPEKLHQLMQLCRGGVNASVVPTPSSIS